MDRDHQGGQPIVCSELLSTGDGNGLMLCAEVTFVRIRVEDRGPEDSAPSLGAY